MAPFIKIGNFYLSLYLFFNVVGVLFSFLFVLHYLKKENIDSIESLTFIMFFWTFFIFGSFLYTPIISFIKNPLFYLKNPNLLFSSHMHSMLTGILTLLVFEYLYLKKFFKEKGLLIANLSAVSFSLYQAIGKLGCFSAGCCYGKPTNFFLGMKFEHLGRNIHPLHNIKIHPTQLYESFFNFINFIILIFMFKRKKKYIFPVYLINYGGIRFFEEFLRGDPRYIKIKISHSIQITAPQLISLFLILLGISFIFLLRHKKSELWIQAKNNNINLL